MTMCQICDMFGIFDIVGVQDRMYSCKPICKDIDLSSDDLDHDFVSLI